MVAIPVVVLIGVVLILVGVFFLMSDQYWFLTIALPTHPPTETICGWASILTQQMEGNDYFCHSF